MVRLREPEHVKQKLYEITGYADQRNLAAILKINRKTLGRILRGQRIHRKDNAAKLATALGEEEKNIFQAA